MNEEIDENYCPKKDCAYHNEYGGWENDRCQFCKQNTHLVDNYIPEDKYYE